MPTYINNYNLNHRFIYHDIYYSLMRKVVWVYQIDTKNRDFFESSVVDTKYTDEIKQSIENDTIDVELEIDLEGIESIGMIQPRYGSDFDPQMHSLVELGSIFLIYDPDQEKYRYLAQALFTGRDRERSLIRKISPHHRTYLIGLTEPIKIDLNKKGAQSLFGYSKEDPSENIGNRMAVAPNDSCQKNFLNNIQSLQQFVDAVRIEPPGESELE